ncbi:hypothetical protein TNCV_4874091 [Trichonephila clavipes]|nr:hypothetical protein TNCV_4874091 [Trichonephila clavipes]
MKALKAFVPNDYHNSAEIVDLEDRYACAMPMIMMNMSETLRILTQALMSHPQSDEAHFGLNGYVSKQNCRIWSEANPQVYVETPLHPEKLTVWCALWAGGILLQKR